MNLTKPILVWDLPIRVFHWLLVITFAGAWLTAESEKYQLIHYAFGYSAGALVLFRIAWGFTGTKYARFSDFVKGPKAVVHHLCDMSTNMHKEQYSGHNPAGSIMMVMLLLLVLAIVVTGYWNVKELYQSIAEDWHESLANITLWLIILHILAAVVMSYLSKINLVKSMVTGKKLGEAVNAIPSQKRLVGLILFISITLFFYLTLKGFFSNLTT
ncbi:MAG: cytochrome b/b6 domain-containing protein [Methylophilaceae bacterium]